MNRQDHEFVIAGAGIAGMTLALLLHRMGKRVVIVEKRPRHSFLEEELRSINFTLTARGLATLERLGLRERVLARAVKLNQRAVHGRNGKTSTQPYGTRESHAIYSIRRVALLQILQEALERMPGVVIEYGATIDSADHRTGTLGYTRDGRTDILHAETIFAADGAFSRVRTLFLEQSAAQCELQNFPWRYMEIQGGEDFVRTLNLDNDTLHVWPGENALLVGIPNPDTTISLMFLSENLQDDRREHFVEIFGASFPHVKITPDMETQLRTMPLGRLVTSRLSNWSHEDRIVFVGDACHAVLPFYGQGMNAALEDCFVICEMLETGMAGAQAFAAYEARRRPQTDALAALSRAHFDSLRQGALSPRWQAAAMTDLLFSHLSRGRWFYEYEQVAHTNTPYDRIVTRLRQQKRIKKLSGVWLFELAIGSAIVISQKVRSLPWKHLRSLSPAKTSVPSPR
ncbi:FAD-dependent oxidoreductase [Burkholderia sp. S-53]|uniref:FAD-dependent oxidoreductase n=1 Tax=Burkholderia sp. S-53 TaxID=2906514 RepID=UPI0021D2E583|nr:NAD(P)/FAD-dependent oxidoreductase [Burkholderia sp. S-53]UXU85566.1 FAD-dependent monooxygenase [Burkholderia sp. S-53]